MKAARSGNSNLYCKQLLFIYLCIYSFIYLFVHVYVFVYKILKMSHQTAVRRLAPA